MFENLIVVGLKKRIVHTLTYYHMNEWTDRQLALALDESEKTIREWRKEDAEIKGVCGGLKMEITEEEKKRIQKLAKKHRLHVGFVISEDVEDKTLKKGERGEK